MLLRILIFVLGMRLCGTWNRFFAFEKRERVCAGLSLALYLTWYYVGSPGECFLLSTVCVQAWLERAENAAKAKKEVDGYNGNEKKRKRTSIAAPEKRSLEAYFTVQPRWALSLIISNPINRKTFSGPVRRKSPPSPKNLIWRKTWSACGFVISVKSKSAWSFQPIIKVSLKQLTMNLSNQCHLLL